MRIRWINTWRYLNQCLLYSKCSKIFNDKNISVNQPFSFSLFLIYLIVMNVNTARWSYSSSQWTSGRVLKSMYSHSMSLSMAWCHEVLKKTKQIFLFCVKIHICYCVNICQVINKTSNTSPSQLVANHIFLISRERERTLSTLRKPKTGNVN